MKFPFFFIIVFCTLVSIGFAQQAGEQAEPAKKSNPFFEPLVPPDRTVRRLLEQADRLFEAGRTNEAAQTLGNVLENANFGYIIPESSDKLSQRTLNETINDFIIDRLRKLPKEAQSSYAFQFEPTAKRLLENAVQAGSLDEIRQVAQKYFASESGAAAAFIIGMTQFERGDYAAAFLSLDKLKQKHPALPETLEPVLTQTLESIKNQLDHAGEQPQTLKISESAWLEQIGWRLPTGSPSQNPNTKATRPLIEESWKVPLFSRSQNERAAEILTQRIQSGNNIYIPAAQPLIVGDRLIARTDRETVAIDLNTGKRLWFAPQPEYRFPSNISNIWGIPPYWNTGNFQTTIRFFSWHDRISQQLSSDGERFYGIEGHRIQSSFRDFGRQKIAGKWEDRRNDPGNTLTARNLKNGQIVWQAGKFPYIQKYFDLLFAEPNKSAKKQEGKSVPSQTAVVDESRFTEDEKSLKETYFLGAPLPLQNRLYVIGENDGIIQLYVLESETGLLLTKQPLAHSASSLATNFVRQTYPLFPAASGGIVICPTGSGLIAALDATTVTPIWCFSYVETKGTTANPANRALRNQMQMMPGININEHQFAQLFLTSGWQVPGILIDRQRVLVAPPDRPSLYCLDLLTGELLWEKDLTRSKSLYVACIQDNHVFAVTPNRLIAFDMETGKEKKERSISFPETMKPAGTGVHSGNRYFIPFSDGYLASADLTDGKLTWLNVDGEVAAPPVVPKQVAAPEAVFIVMPPEAPVNIFSPDLNTQNVFRKPVQFGNLIGIKGRFISQSPLQIACFDQKEPLQQRAEKLLGADPNDPVGLFQQGRILKSEGKTAESIESLRSSLKAKPTAEAADTLRKALLNAMRNDYAAWSNAGEELESLAEFPDEWGEILYARAEGILRNGKTDDLVSLLKKVFGFSLEEPILILADDHLSANLHRALGSLIDQSMAKEGTDRKNSWEELAETFYQQHVNRSENKQPAETFKKFETGQSAKWERNSSLYSSEILHWIVFIELFRGTSAAEKAKQHLRKEFEKHHLHTALELLDQPSTSEMKEPTEPFVWKQGSVDVKDVTALNNVAVRSNENSDQGQQKINYTINNTINQILRLARDIDPGVLMRSMRNVPVLDQFDSLLPPFNYFFETSQTASYLSCCTISGEERWRLPLPSDLRSDEMSIRYYGRQYGMTDQSVYIKELGHYLLFVTENTITAIDTGNQSDSPPKILWVKTVSSVLLNRQNIVTDSIPNIESNLSRYFPKSSLFVSPHAVCCRDADYVYGLEPMTGQTLWIRKIPQEQCSIFGDSGNVFLVFPDVCQAMAVDPSSGRELASGTIPTGGIYTFGTNIVFLKQSERGNIHRSLLIGDLRGLFDKRRRALLVSDTAQGREIPSLPTELMLDNLNHTSLIQMLRNDRYLAAVTWGTQTLQIYDLLLKQKMLPEKIDLSLIGSELFSNLKSPSFDVEFIGENFLVTFVKSNEILHTQETIQIKNASVKRNYGVVNGVSSVPLGSGMMMLFDKEGKTCWSEPVEIKNWYKLLNVPKALPVSLFAVGITDRNEKTNENLSYTGLMGVDKRSGAVRFRKLIPPLMLPTLSNGQSIALHGFQVFADPQTEAISFVVPSSMPRRIVKATFTDETEKNEEP